MLKCYKLWNKNNKTSKSIKFINNIFILQKRFCRLIKFIKDVKDLFFYLAIGLELFKIIAQKNKNIIIFIEIK
jgi:hypothetical protein